MRVDQLTIALRPRPPWEATDLGLALVRRHAARIWAPWVLVTLPAALAASAIGWALDAAWLGGLLLWWWKPLFDRVPLFVLSRAVFGEAPSLRDTVRAQWSWGWRACLAWLTWRRLHPGRAMLLPVDLLEGSRGRQRSLRVRTLSRAHGSHNVLVTVVCVHLEVILAFSLMMLALMFVPIEFLSDSAKAMWDTLFEQPPAWAEVVLTLIGWLAMSIVEPFFIGAGFGLYLNRRTELEAWDIELAFRRMAARLAGAATALALILVSLALPGPARAADPPSGAAEATAAGADDSLRAAFGDAYRDDAPGFEAAVRKAYEDPDLAPRSTVYVWEPRGGEPAGGSSKQPAWLEGIGRVIAFIAEFGLWIVGALLVGLALLHHRRWLPWFTARLGPRDAPTPVALVEPPRAESLPQDLAAAVRGLWNEGQPRAALALLYRAAVRRLGATLDVELPVGATESECLRCARRLDDAAPRALFGAIVRHWQSAAYADRLPRRDEVEALLEAWPAAWSPRA
jgi:hypothetical protein